MLHRQLTTSSGLPSTAASMSGAWAAMPRPKTSPRRISGQLFYIEFEKNALLPWKAAEAVLLTASLPLPGLQLQTS